MQIVTPLWRHTATAQDPSVPLEGPLEVDAAVIGAGFTGLRAALALAEAGAGTAVFDAQRVAHGASGRSGGQVNPMLPLPRPEDLLRAVGPRYFERMAEVSLKSADDLFALVRRCGIDCDARQNGWIRADHCAEARRVARENAALWNRHGAGFEFLGGTDVERLTGARGYGSGTLAPRGGAVQPLSLALGLARAAVAAGARIFAPAPVTAMHRFEGRWHLTAGGQRVTAGQVLVATNGYTGGLVRGLRGSVLPLRSVQIATGPLSADRLGPLLPEGHTISDTRRLIMYSRREPGGQFVFGGIGFRKLLGGTGGIGWLLKDAARTFPSLEGAEWRYRWGGAIALTADHVPHLHQPAPGLIAGLGYNGRGVAMSHVMGREMARLALGTPPGDLPLPVTPVAPYPFRLPQVLGAGLALAWMRLRDEAEARQDGAA